jgi:chromosomal replication initiation ATPase DnaA
MENELLEKIDQLSARLSRLEPTGTETAERVFLFIQREMGITRLELLGDARGRHISTARKFAYWLLHYQELLPKMTIARLLKRTHNVVEDGLSRMNDVFYFEANEPEQQREFTNLVKKWESNS